MAVTASEAKIRVRLDVQEASKEMDRLERAQRDLDEAQKRQATEGERARRDEESKKFKPVSEDTRQHRFMEGVKQLARQVIGGIELAAMAAQATLPPLAQAIEAIAGAEAAQPINRRLNEFAAELTMLRAQMNSILPAFEETVAISRAGLLLGGKLPEDPIKLYEELFKLRSEFQSLQANVDRQLNTEVVDRLIKHMKGKLPN